MLSGGLAWFMSLPAWAVALFAFACAVAAAFLFKLLTRFWAFAWIIMIIVAAWGLAWHQRGVYELEIGNVVVGFLPALSDRSLVQGAEPALEFKNNNGFPIYVSPVRLIASIDGNGTDVDVEDQEPIMINAHAPKEIHAAGVQFVSNLNPNEMTSGNLDFILCYGRDKGDLSRGLAIRAYFTLRFDENGKAVVHSERRSVKAISCVR